MDRQQPTLVVNQLGQTPNLERGPAVATGTPPPFSVNGQQQPTLTMYPGQVQLWRIVNGSPISGFYLSSLPADFTWRQTAQDGVQFDPENYKERAQRPVFVAPGNRIDLLVRAPVDKPLGEHFYVTVDKATSVSTAQEGNGVSETLFSVVLSGSGQPMPLIDDKWIDKMPRPSFLHDITPAEVAGPGHARTIVFETTAAASGHSQHTIDIGKGPHKFGEKDTPPIEIGPLNTAEEWTVENKTVGVLIDHPFHIHVNPFQITEVFDPNAPLLDKKTGFPVAPSAPLYVVSPTKPEKLETGQCWLNPNDPTTWHNCNTSPGTTDPSKTNIWWDVFPIPAGIQSGTTIIPGYFKMRSRFVDYRGYYVLHCHILAHEDRGMMVEVLLDWKNVSMEHH